MSFLGSNRSIVPGTSPIAPSAFYGGTSTAQNPSSGGRLSWLKRQLSNFKGSEPQSGEATGNQAQAIASVRVPHGPYSLPGAMRAVRSASREAQLMPDTLLLERGSELNFAQSFSLTDLHELRLCFADNQSSAMVEACLDAEKQRLFQSIRTALTCFELFDRCFHDFLLAQDDPDRRWQIYNFRGDALTEDAKVRAWLGSGVHCMQEVADYGQHSTVAAEWQDVAKTAARLLPALELFVQHLKPLEWKLTALQGPAILELAEAAVEGRGIVQDFHLNHANALSRSPHQPDVPYACRVTPPSYDQADTSPPQSASGEC